MYHICNNCSADRLFTVYSNTCRAYVYSTLFGASLSEPHTSVTALLDAYVCVYVCVWPYTENLN